jgi:hypothetical protein
MSSPFSPTPPQPIPTCICMVAVTRKLLAHLRDTESIWHQENYSLAGLWSPASSSMPTLNLTGYVIQSAHLPGPFVCLGSVD